MNESFRHRGTIYHVSGDIPRSDRALFALLSSSQCLAPDISGVLDSFTDSPLHSSDSSHFKAVLTGRIKL